MGLRVEDGGRSECLPVMGRIGVEPGSCTVSATDRVHHPTRKRADFLPRSLVTRKLDKPSREGKQMTAGFGPAGALSCVARIGTVAVLCNARWHQACIVKLRQALGLSQRVLLGGLLGGLSGLTRKCHGPFLGGWGAAMPPGYPTRRINTVETSPEPKVISRWILNRPVFNTTHQFV
jgi:hypothetical protein